MERTGHPPSSAEAKNVKSLTLHARGHHQLTDGQCELPYSVVVISCPNHVGLPRTLNLPSVNHFPALLFSEYTLRSYLIARASFKRCSFKK